MRRGDVVLTVLAGDYGKPRPAVIVQSDLLSSLDSVILSPFTSNLTTAGPARVQINPSEVNGLEVPSLIMVDKVNAVSRSRCRQIIGRLTSSELAQLNAKLMTALGLNDPVTMSGGR